MGTSTFADRFWYARHAKGMGAPTLMKRVAQLLQLPEGEELSPSLISMIERKNQKSSRYNEAFAQVLEVDAAWLANDAGPAPRGFDADDARMGRLTEVSKNQRGTPVALGRRDVTPAWAAPIEANEELRVQRFQMKLTADLYEYASLVGVERAKAFLHAIEPLLATFATKESSGEKKLRPVK